MCENIKVPPPGHHYLGSPKLKRSTRKQDSLYDKYKRLRRPSDRHAFVEARYIEDILGLTDTSEQSEPHCHSQRNKSTVVYSFNCKSWNPLLYILLRGDRLVLTSPWSKLHSSFGFLTCIRKKKSSETNKSTYASKRLFSLLKNSKQDLKGSAPLKKDGKLYSDTVDEANILSQCSDQSHH